MKLKTVEVNGNLYAEVQDGKPVFEQEDGRTVAFDAPGTIATISRINSEARAHRIRAEEFEAKLKPFEGIEDPEAALSALNTVRNLDAKKLVDAGEVEKVREAAIKAVEEKYAHAIKAAEEKYTHVTAERDGLLASLVAEKVGGNFARSKYISDKLAIPADMVQARFGDAFKVEGDAVVAYDRSNNKLYSRSNPGELAGFEEALEMLVEQYPYRDHILKGSGASGGGAQGGGGNAAGSKTLNRAAFAQLSPDRQMAHIKSGGAITD